jgi:hypothetical protein
VVQTGHEFVILLLQPPDYRCLPPHPSGVLTLRCLLDWSGGVLGLFSFNTQPVLTGWAPDLCVLLCRSSKAVMHEVFSICPQENLFVLSLILQWPVKWQCPRIHTHSHTNTWMHTHMQYLIIRYSPNNSHLVKGAGEKSGMKCFWGRHQLSNL